MQQGNRAVDHREYEDLIAGAALGALSPDEHTALRDHMRDCAACRQAYGRLLSAADALPLSVEEREPPATLRERLQAMVSEDARMRPWQHAATAIEREDDIAPIPLRPAADQPARERPPRLQPWWLAAAAAILVVGLVAGALLGRALLEDESPQAEEIALQFPSGMELEDATLKYMPEEEMLHFSAPGMPSAPEGMVYQVWLIGDAPVPMGMVDPATGEFASMVDTSAYRTFAVTVEPGPLGNAEPSSDPVIVAELPAA